MAEPIQHQPEARDTDLDAHEELERLLQTLHDQGVLRLLNDWMATAPQISSLLVEGLRTEGANNAVQNLAVIAQILGRIPPGQLYQTLSAVAVGMERTTTYASEADPEPPGLRGAYQLLKDEQLWGVLTPLIEGLKASSHELGRRVEKPGAEMDRQQAHVRDPRGTQTGDV